MTIQRLDEILAEADAKGLNEVEKKLVRSDFIYGMFTYKVNTPFRGLMTREHSDRSEDAGYIQAHQCLYSILAKKEKGQRTYFAREDDKPINDQ